MALVNNFGNSSAVKQYYENYLGRTPTESEIQWWLANHNSTAEIQTGITASPEARTRAEDLVRQIYGSIGRTGIGGAVNQIDSGGFEAWVNHFLSGKSTAANLQADFDVAVNDYMTQNPNDQYTTYVKSFKTANMTDGEIWRAAEASGDYSEVAKRINGLSKAEVKSKFGLSDADLAYVYSRPGIVAPQETAANTTTSTANNTATNTANDTTNNTAANTSNATTTNTTNTSNAITEAVTSQNMANPYPAGTYAHAYYETLPDFGTHMMDFNNKSTINWIIQSQGLESSLANLNNNQQYKNFVQNYELPDKPVSGGNVQSVENIYKELKGQSQNLGTEKTLQTGAAGTKEGGLGSADNVMWDMARKLADAGLTSIEQFGQGKVPIMETVYAQPEYVAGTQIVSYSENGPEYNQVPSGRWFYNVQEIYGDNDYTTRHIIDNAEVARLGLSGTGAKTVNLKTGEKDGFINKATGEPLTSLTGYDGRGWSGTSAGDGQTIYNVQFDAATGLPIFYNQQKHGKDDYADLLKVLAIGTAIFAPQIGAALLPAGSSAAAALAVGSAVSGLIGSGGDIKAGIKAGLAAYLGGQAGSWASRTANSALVGNIATNMTRAAILGGDMEQALISSLVQAAPAEIVKQFPSFSQLPRAAQEAAVAATVDLMRTGGENLSDIALQGATKGATDYALSNIEGYKDLRPAQQEIVRTRVSNVLGGADLSDELLQGAIAFGTEAVQYQINDEKAKNDGWEGYEQQQAAKRLYGDKVTPAQYADKQITTEAEAKDIARSILGREPTEFEYMQLVGLTENAAAQNSDLAAIRSDESTFDSYELIEAYKKLYGKEPTDEWLAANTDLLGRSDAQATTMLQDAFNENRGTTNNTEAEAIWKATGNTGPIPEDLLFQMLSSPENAARAMAETYAIRQQDIRETTFDGRGYGSPQNAKRAAEAAGYNNYTWEGETFTIPPSYGSDKTAERKLELVTQLLSSKGITIASASNEQFRSALDEVNNIPTGMLGNATLQDIVSGKYTSVNLNGGPYRVEVQGAPVYSDYLTDSDKKQKINDQLPPGLKVASLSDVWDKDDKRVQGDARLINLPDGSHVWVLPALFLDTELPPSVTSRGTIEELEVSDPEAWLQLASKFEKDATGTLPDYLVNTANALMLGAYATGNKDFGDAVKQTLSIATQGVGQQVTSMATFFTDRLGMDHNSAMARAGKALQDWGVANQSVSTKAQEDKIIDAVNKADGVGGKIKAFAVAAYNNPGGFMTMVAKEGIQEILPLWAAKAAYRFGSLAAVSANTAIETIESWGSGTKDAYDEAKRMGFNDADARTMASKVGLQSAVITAFTNGFGDNPLVKRIVGDVVQDSAMGITKASAREGFTEYFDGLLQNASQQYQLTGNVNWDQATTAATIGMGVGAGTTGGIMTGAAINSTAVIGKDFAGNNVSYADFMSGDKQVNMSTVNPSTQVGVTEDGEPITLGTITAMSVTSDTPFEMVTSGMSPDIEANFAAYEDTLSTTKEEARSFFTEIFGVAPTDDQLTEFIGKSEAAAKDLINQRFGDQQSNAANNKTATDAGFPNYSAYLQYDGNLANYTAAVTATANAKIATDAGFPDFATYSQYGGDKRAYDAAQTAAANKQTAIDAGFPDFATYTQYAGNLNAYNAAITDAANIRTATDAGFPDYATFKQYNGDIAAYTAARTEENNRLTATSAGFPDFATYTQYNGDKSAYDAAVSAAANAKLATEAGFPDFAAYTKYNGNLSAYNTATTAAANAQKATDAGFPDFDTYTRYEGNAANYQADVAAKTAGFADAAEQTAASTAGYTDATAYKNYLADTANTAKATAAGFPDYGTYTQFNGDLAAFNASKLTSETTTAINNAIAGIRFPAGVSSTDVAAQIKAAMDANPSLKAADVATAISDYMAANPNLTAADVNTAISNATKNFATKTDIEAAIANIQFPAGITAADVAAEIKAALDANPGLSAADVTKSITDYMTANPGLTAADVSTAITNATSDFVTNTSFEKALSDLSADAKTQFDTLTQGQKDIIASQVAQGKDIAQAITDVSTGFQSKIDTLTGDVKTQFDTLTQGQKDIVASQVQMGTDLNTAIANVAAQTATDIADVKTEIGNLSADVQTKFDGLTQTQKDIVDAQVKMGVDLNTAIDEATKQTTQQITDVKTDLTKNITDVQTQFNTRVDELVLQGKTYQEATQVALKELDEGVTGLTSSVEDIQKKQEEEAAARRAAQAQAKAKSNLGQAMSLIAPAAAAAAAGSDDTPYRQIGLKTTGEAKFEGPLEQYLKMVKENTYASKPTQPETQQQNQQVAPVQDELSTIQQQPQENNYFAYGQQSEIDHLLREPEGTGMLYSKAGGLATPMFAGGGTTRHGRYSGGGLGVVHHSGKPRLDFRKGDAVTGAGDGQSDDIPAMLADGEFVIPADVVAALGNGSTKAGSDKLYDMMHSIRAYHRAAKPKDLPPPAKKSPLDYLKKPASKARR